VPPGGPPPVPPPLRTVVVRRGRPERAAPASDPAAPAAPAAHTAAALPAPATARALDVGRLADEVIEVIDQRIVAQRERSGRF